MDDSLSTSQVKEYVDNLIDRAVDEADKVCVDLPEQTAFISQMISLPQFSAMYSGRQFTLAYVARQCYFMAVAVILGWRKVLRSIYFDQALSALCFWWMKVHRYTKVRFGT